MHRILFSGLVLLLLLSAFAGCSRFSNAPEGETMPSDSTSAQEEDSVQYSDPSVEGPEEGDTPDDIEGPTTPPETNALPQ